MISPIGFGTGNGLSGGSTSESSSVWTSATAIARNSLSDGTRTVSPHSQDFDEPAIPSDTRMTLPQVQAISYSMVDPFFQAVQRPGGDLFRWTSGRS